MCKGNNQLSAPSLDFLGVFQESTLFSFDFLRVLNSNVPTYWVCNSILVDNQKCNLNDSDTRNEFHDAKELVFAEGALVAHYLKTSHFMQLLADLPMLTMCSYVLKNAFWGSKMLPALNPKSCLIFKYVLKQSVVMQQNSCAFN